MTQLADIFDTQECTRCQGCGRYSFNQIDGDKCYGCNGTGLQYTKAHKPLVSELRAALKSVRETTLDKCNEGDTVLLGERYVAENGKPMRRWVDIVSIQHGTHEFTSQGTTYTQPSAVVELSDGQTLNEICARMIVKVKSAGIRDERVRSQLSAKCLAVIDNYLAAC